MSNNGIRHKAIIISSYTLQIHIHEFSTPNSFQCLYYFSFAVVNQEYTVQVHDEYVMSGNTAVLKCQVIRNVFCQFIFQYSGIFCFSFFFPVII